MPWRGQDPPCPALPCTAATRAEDMAEQASPPAVLLGFRGTRLGLPPVVGVTNTVCPGTFSFQLVHLPPTVTGDSAQVIGLICQAGNWRRGKQTHLGQ